MNTKSLFILPILATFLASCGFGGTQIINYDSTSLIPIDPQQPDSGDGYQKISEFAYNLQDVKKTTETNGLSSTGDSKLLVVPVQFSNAPEWTNAKLEVIQRAFFGEAGETSWQSVASYYKTSSYGNLNISGEITPVFKLDVTMEEASSYVKDDNPSPDAVVTSYFKEDKNYDELRKKYDVDNDGYVDSIAFIYSNSPKSQNGYWAWVYWTDEGRSSELPNVNAYLWMSYSFFTGSRYAGYGSGIDAHTAIHEVGHLLGLDDYYLYQDDPYEKTFDPSGGIEMHSYNIGDDNIYSKFALGWVNPYYVKTEKSVSLKLRSSALYGDAIIINDSWNMNSMDEYLIIEYYTPQGMNEKDALQSYSPNTTSGTDKMYTVNGFRIYHIDSRLVEIEARGRATRYVETLGDKYYAVGASNTPERSHLSDFQSMQNAIDYKYVHLLESNGTNTFKKGSFATNATLFKGGSSFVASSEFFPNGDKFNNGTTVGYKITVQECTSDFGEITITKI